MMMLEEKKDKKDKDEEILPDPGDPQEVEKLLTKRAELVSLLRSVRRSLEVNDQPVIEEDPFKNTEVKQSGLWDPKRGHFTERGSLKSAELFRKFAAPDGTMSYLEFRGYLAAVGRPDELPRHIIDFSESWRCYMYDLFGLDRSGRLLQTHFELYRERLEATYCLEFDLLRVGIPLLTPDLLAWRNYKRSFDNIASETTATEEALYELRRWGLEYVHKVPLPSLQLMLFDSGELITHEQQAWLRLMLINHNHTMKDLRETYKRRNKFSEHQDSKVDPEDQEHIYYDAHLALMFSRRTKPALRLFEKAFIWAKLQGARTIRGGVKFLNRLYANVKALTERGLLESKVFTRLRQEGGKYGAKWEVGNAESSDEGLGASINYIFSDNAAQTFASMGLPSGIGSALVLDFLLRSEIDPSIVKTAVAKLMALVEEHVEAELKTSIPSYHSFKIFEWNHETDQLPVLRIAILLKPETSIDFLFRTLGLVLKLPDIIHDLSCEMHFSHPLTEILESKKLALDKSFGFGGVASATVARKVLAKLLEELQWAVEDREANAGIEARERKEMFGNAHGRTKEAIFSKFGADMPEPVEMTITGHNEDPKVLTDEEIRLKNIEALSWRRYFWRVVNLLHGLKGFESEMTFRDMAELLFETTWVRNHLPAWITPDIVEPGAVSGLWKQAMVTLKEQVDKHWRKILQVERAQQDAEDQKERKRREEEAKMSKAERRRLAFLEEKRQLAEKLKGLGIEVDDDLAKTDDLDAKPLEYARHHKSQQAATERRILEAYEASWNAMCAFHGIQIQTGGNRFVISVQGCDIFEFLPQPPASPPKPTSNL